MTDPLARLSRPIDAASLTAFRVLFGGLMAYGAVRFVAEGWVEKVFGQPTRFIPYWGLELVPPLGVEGVYALFALMALGGLGVMLGAAYRLSAFVFLVAFTWVELIDVTNYLNHHYLAWLLALGVAVAPLHRHGSVDAWLRPALRRDVHPAWMLGLLRFQIAVVYAGAALAKVGPDWLLHGQPLGIWLSARTETPVLGPLFAWSGAPLLMSWAGFAYDATIVLWLSWRRSRPVAYAAVLVFHGLTAVLFDIGLFPLLMSVATLAFFSPSWPRALFGRGRAEVGRVAPALRPLGPVGAGVLATFALFQVLFPLRAHLYGGDVLWHEQGMRWSWRVMVREKNGSVTYRARDPRSGREWEVSPTRYLTWRQANEMSGQPDVILRVAHWVAEDLAAQGHPGVEVRADAWVSLNGRPPARLVDPEVDLARVQDGLAPAAWIRPAPAGPPLPAGRRSPRSTPEIGAPTPELLGAAPPMGGPR